MENQNILENQEVEEALVSGVLLSRTAMTEVASIVKPEMFGDPKLGLVYRAMYSLHTEGVVPDLVSVDVRMRQTDEALWKETGGLAVLHRGMLRSRSDEGVKWYAEEVKRRYMSRLLHALFARQAEKAAAYGSMPGELVEETERELISIREDYTVGNPVRAIAEMAERVLALYEKRLQGGENEMCIPTGIDELDFVTGGLHRGELTVAAGRPGDGKTATAMCIAIQAALAGKAVCYFSMEMTELQTMNRIFTGYAGVLSEHLRVTGLTADELGRVKRLTERLRQWPLYFDYTPGNTVENIRAQAVLQKKRGKCDLVVVDYLHLIDNKLRPGETLDQAIGRNIQALKRLAVEIECPVLVLSQMNRESERRADKTHVPELHNLRDSGVIEQVADCVFFIYRPERYGLETDPTTGENLKGLCKLYIQKNRNGALGIASFRYNDSFTRILNPPKTFKGMPLN